MPQQRLHFQGQAHCTLPVCARYAYAKSRTPIGEKRMAPTKIMLIRHAEKPDETGAVLGVDESGRANPNQLSVRGWQRAGALVRFFAASEQARSAGIETPSAIFACKPHNGSSSVRPFSTVQPLAASLGIPVHYDTGKSEEAALLNAAGSISGTVLICWPHEPIPNLVRGLAGELPGVPIKWPGKRFDLVWILDRTGTGWRFYQAAQLLLPGDAPAS
jgi:hypothetical protein